MFRKDAEGYVRLSKGDNNYTDLGEDVQRHAITSYCEIMRINLVRIVPDIGVSASKAIRSRPGGKEIIESVITHKRVLIAFRQDRLFRDAVDALTTMKELLDAGVETILIRDGSDLTTADGMFAFTLKAAFAQLERSRIGERTKEALDRKRSRGERISRHAPYGYQFVSSERTNKNGFPVKVITKQPDEQRAIALMLELHAEKYSFRRIAHNIEGEGYPPRSGKYWQPSVIRDIIREEKRRRKEAGDQAGDNPNAER